MTITRLVRILVLGAAATLLAPLHAHAQSSAPAAADDATRKVNERLAEMDLQIKLLKKELELTQAQSDLIANQTSLDQNEIKRRYEKIAEEQSQIKAIFPTNQTLTSGNITLLGNSSIPDAFAYDASGKLTEAVARDIDQKISSPSGFLIVSSSLDFRATGRLYDVTKARFQNYSELAKTVSANAQKLADRFTTTPPFGLGSAEEKARALLEDVSKPETTRLGSGAFLTLGGVNAMSPMMTASSMMTGGVDAIATANSALVAVNSTLQTMLQLASLFKTDVTLTSQQTEISDEAIIGQLAQGLIARDRKVYTTSGVFASKRESPILKLYSNLSQKSREISHLSEVLSEASEWLTNWSSDVNAKIDEVAAKANADAAKATPPTKKYSEEHIRAAKKRVEAILKTLDADTYKRQAAGLAKVGGEIATGLNAFSSSADGKQSQLDALMEYEHAKAVSTNRRCIRVHVFQASGTTRTDKNFWTNFVWSAEPKYLGVATVSFEIIDDESSQRLYSRVGSCVVGFRPARALNSVTEPPSPKGKNSPPPVRRS